MSLIGFLSIVCPFNTWAAGCFVFANRLISGCWDVDNISRFPLSIQFVLSICLDIRKILDNAIVFVNSMCHVYYIRKGNGNLRAMGWQSNAHDNGPKVVSCQPLFIALVDIFRKLQTIASKRQEVVLYRIAVHSPSKTNILLFFCFPCLHLDSSYKKAIKSPSLITSYYLLTTTTTYKLNW